MLYLPTLKKEIARPWFLPSQEVLDAQRQLLNNTYFLVKQGDAFGERLRCTRCGRRHDYITLMCVEQPFTGMTGGLYAYYRAITDNKLENDLNPQERSRFHQVTSALGGMQDISRMHPELARKITSGLGPTDMQLGAISYGVLEGIAAVHAAALVRKINDRGLRPKLVLETPKWR